MKTSESFVDVIVSHCSCLLGKKKFTLLTGTKLLHRYPRSRLCRGRPLPYLRGTMRGARPIANKPAVSWTTEVVDTELTPILRAIMIPIGHLLRSRRQNILMAAYLCPRLTLFYSLLVSTIRMSLTTASQTFFIKLHGDNFRGRNVLDCCRSKGNCAVNLRVCWLVTENIFF